jgi:hypothetical protein
VSILTEVAVKRGLKLKFGEYFNRDGRKEGPGVRIGRVF